MKRLYYIRERKWQGIFVGRRYRKASECNLISGKARTFNGF
jgi:hypothetical protein